MGSKCTIINQMQDSFPNVGFECFEWDIIFDPRGFKIFAVSFKFRESILECIVSVKMNQSIFIKNNPLNDIDISLNTN